MLVGLIFLATGFTEAWREMEHLSLGAHHGAIVFGLLHTLKYFPDFIEGLEYVQKTARDKT